MLRVACAIGAVLTICGAAACTANGPLVPAAAVSPSPGLTAAPPSPAATVYRCSRVELSAGPEPLEVGAFITFTATGYGCDPVDYRFLWLQVETGDWQVARDWGPSPQWTWNTWTFSPAKYSIVADARARYELGNGPDVSISMPLVLTSPETPPSGSPGRANQCTAVTISASEKSPPAGTVVFYKVAATGCSEPEYRFHIVDLSTGLARLARNWGPSTDGVWETKNLPPGRYAIQVEARESGPNLAGYVVDTSAQVEVDLQAVA